MITYANIGHFKSIAELSIPLGGMNVIVGRNGVGKSNLVDALYFLRDCVVEDLDTAVTKRHGIDSIRQWSKTRPYHVSIEVLVKSMGNHGRYKMVLASGGGNYRILEEQGEWTTEDIFHSSPPGDASRMVTTKFHRDHNGEINVTGDSDNIRLDSERRSRLSSGDLYITSLAGQTFSWASMLLNGLGKTIANFVAYSIYPNTLRQPQVLSKREELASDGSNLGSILKRINTGNRKSKESIVESLKVLMPSVTDFRVISAGGFHVPVVRVTEPWGESHEFNMSQISDGTLRVLGILTAFYQPSAPSIIALEEPEQMIHPGALPVIVDSANDYIRRDPDNRQVFITTHSPTLLDKVDPESIISANFKGGLTEYAAISKRQLGLIKEHLFTAGEIMLSEGFE